jgi:hypothetical protein
MAKLFRVRKPRLRVSKRGKVSSSGGGISIGGKSNHINISKSGVSNTIGVPGVSYNSKRGLRTRGVRLARRGGNCSFVLLLLVVTSGILLGTAGYTILSILD